MKGEFGKARFPTNKLIVNPMPVNTPTAYKFIHEQCLGLSAQPNLIAAIEKANTPSCLPTNHPSKTPSVTLSKTWTRLTPSRLTPAFANAKIGMIIKETYGATECSIFFNNEVL